MSDTTDTLPNPNPEGHELSPEQSVPIDPASLARHYEQQDVDVRSIVRFGIAVAVGATVAGVVLWLVLRMWTAQPLPIEVQVAPAEVTPPPVAGPGLDALPESSLSNLMQRENERLHTYGWVDREAGIVHIPIEEAMRLLVERGVPAREGDAPNLGLDPSFRMDASGGLDPVGEENSVVESSVEEPGGAESGGNTQEDDTSSGGDSPGSDASGDDASGGDTSSEGDTPESAPPGGIEPSDPDAGDEEPGGAQSGG